MLPEGGVIVVAPPVGNARAPNDDHRVGRGGGHRGVAEGGCARTAIGVGARRKRVLERAARFDSDVVDDSPDRGARGAEADRVGGTDVGGRRNAVGEDRVAAAECVAAVVGARAQARPAGRCREGGDPPLVSTFMIRRSPAVVSLGAPSMSDDALAVGDRARAAEVGRARGRAGTEQTSAATCNASSAAPGLQRIAAGSVRAACRAPCRGATPCLLSRSASSTSASRASLPVSAAAARPRRRSSSGSALRPSRLLRSAGALQLPAQVDGQRTRGRASVSAATTRKSAAPRGADGRSVLRRRERSTAGTLAAAASRRGQRQRDQAQRLAARPAGRAGRRRVLRSAARSSVRAAAQEQRARSPVRAAARAPRRASRPARAGCPPRAPAAPSGRRRPAGLSAAARPKRTTVSSHAIPPA